MLQHNEEQVCNVAQQLRQYVNKKKHIGCENVSDADAVNDVNGHTISIHDLSVRVVATEYDVCTLMENIWEMSFPSNLASPEQFILIVILAYDA